MSIKKRKALFGHPLQIRSFDFAFWIGGRNITDPQVIGKDKNHVRK